LISDKLFLIRNLLILENGFDPKNPLYADSGDG
jgi:hypothetical protein